ncbi:unnamed protein product [Gadus morhua 'NCC']
MASVGVLLLRFETLRLEEKLEESICATQLITEDEGLGRLAHTVQVLAAVSALGWQSSRPGFKSWHTRSFDLSEVMWSE